MVTNGQQNFYMVQNGPKWFKIVQNCPIWPKWSKIVSEVAKMVQIGQKLIKNSSN